MNPSPQKRLRQPRQRQRRQQRIWTWLRLALSPSLALVLGVGLVIGLNSEAGRDLIARAINAGTSGRVQLTGLGGRLPFAPRLESLQLADADGPWLRIEDAALELDPVALLAAEIEIRSLEAGAVDLLRLPQPNDGPGRSWPPPVALDLQRLAIERLRVNGLVAAAPMLSLQGSAALSREGAIATTLAIKPHNRFGLDDETLHLDLSGSTQPESLDLKWRLDLEQIGVLSEATSGLLRMQGQLRWPRNEPLPVGEIRLEVAKLDQLSLLLAPWLPAPKPPSVAGTLNARLISDQSGSLDVEVDAHALQLPSQLRLERLALQANIQDLLGQPRAESAIQLGGLRSPLAAGDLNAQLSGPITALKLTTEASLEWKQPAHAAMHLSAAGALEPFDRRLNLSAFSLELRRLAPESAHPQAQRADPQREPRQALAQDRLGTDGVDRIAARAQAPRPPQATGELAAQALSGARAQVFAEAPSARAGLGLQLLEPGQIDFGDGLSIDRLTFALSAPREDGMRAAAGRVGLSGRLAPALALDARAIDLPLATLIGLLPSTIRLPAPVQTFEGLIDAETRLEGEHGAPLGRLDLLLREGRSREGAARGLPAGELRLALRLEPQATAIDAVAAVGSRASLDLRGRIEGPAFSRPGALSLRARGRLDAGLLSPQLAASGRTLAGQLALDVDIGGQLAQPRLDGSIRFRDGAWKDRLLGLVLTEIDGEIIVSGDQLTLTRLTARADPGTLQMSGSLDWLAPGRPVDLQLNAREASPLRLDTLEIEADADLRLRGALAGDLDLSGSLRFDQFALRIPERFPATVATLEVAEIGPRRQPRQERQRRAGIGLVSPERVALDLRIKAPRAIRLTGRGVDAELGGEITARGTLADPAIIGDFRLLRGEYELLGQPLRFTRGRIGFDGASVLDPTLDLEARVQAEGATAILSVEGSARQPELRLSGEPEMPDDEVLARLLFGLSRSRLSALQVARLGLAATSLAGIDQPGSALLERTRSRLGLDHFRVDSGADRQGRGDAILEGGRYLSERIYLGARQGTRAGDTQGILRMEVSPRIRLETDVGANGGARAGAAFELEY